MVIIVVMTLNFLYLVDPASVSSKLLVFLYDYVMFYIFVIFLLFIYLVVVLLRDFSFKRSYRIDTILYGFIIIFLWILILIQLVFFIFYFLYFLIYRYLWLKKYVYLLLTPLINFIEKNNFIQEVINDFRKYVRRMLLFFFNLCESFCFRNFWRVKVLNNFILFYFYLSRIGYLFILLFFYFLKVGHSCLNWVVCIWSILLVNRIYIYIYIFLYGFKRIYIKNRYFDYMLLDLNELVIFFDLKTKNKIERFIYCCYNPIFLVGSKNYFDLYFNIYDRILNNIRWSSKLYAYSINVSFLLELVWTLIPTLILFFIAVPSFWILFCIDELVNPLVTIKCIGNQWYWVYEYGGTGLRVDSYMIWPNEGKFGHLRLLEVDDWLRCPVRVPLRFVVTSSDVIHSWAVPAFGIKVDGIPGRLNQVSFYGTRTGFFFGQCSELCGVNHAFMPIMVEVVSVKDFVQYLNLRNLV